MDAPQTTPSFSIIIPTYNRADVFRRTMDHLAAQDYPKDSYELIAVDNSRDETPRVVERFAGEAPFKIHLLADSHPLPAMKRNLGLRAASGDYVLFMNDDVWAAPNLLAEHAKTHEAHPEGVAVLGHVDQSTEMPSTPFVEWYRPFGYQLLADRADQPVPYLFCWSMNLSLPRKQMLADGVLFHEDWKEIGHEDVELGYRWTQAGHQIVYNPRAWGEHYHIHTLQSACRLQESIGRGLRDLERLIPDPGILDHYGVFSWRNNPRLIPRRLIRRALINDVSGPWIEEWLAHQKANSSLTRWLYWKVMLRYTERGYARAGRARSTRG